MPKFQPNYIIDNTPNIIPLPDPQECEHDTRVWENRVAAMLEVEWWCPKCRIHWIEKVQVDFDPPKRGRPKKSK